MNPSTESVMAQIQQTSSKRTKMPAPRVWMPRFLEAYRLTGCNMTQAARMAGVDRTTALKAKLRSKSFAAALAAIEPEPVEAVELTLYQRALAGESWAVKLYLRAHKPELYGERISVDLNLVSKLAAELGLDEAEILAEAESLVRDSGRVLA